MYRWHFSTGIGNLIVEISYTCNTTSLYWIRVLNLGSWTWCLQIGWNIHIYIWASNQVGCSCTWQRSLSCETNTGATEEVPAPNQSWRGCNHLTLNWPYQGHQIPYLVPRTADWLSPLWSNTDHRPYAAGVSIVTGMSWWILHSRLTECSLWDNSWDLHSGIPARSGILLSDMM